MAAIVPAIATENPGPLGPVQTNVWAPLVQGDTALPVTGAERPNRSVQASGTWNGATLTLQGSNDGTTYFVLTDTAGTPGNLSFTADGLKQVRENTAFTKPVLSGGGGSTSLKVVLVEAIAPGGNF